jgi:hypothetical protein
MVADVVMMLVDQEVPIFRRFLYDMVLFFGMVLFLYQDPT